MLVALTTTACSAAGSDNQPTPGQALVTGSVTFRERIALPPDADVQVWIADQASLEPAAPHVAEASVPAAGRQVPIPFELAYDPAKIEPDHDYVVEAAISVRGRPLFTTQVGQTVLTKGRPRQADLMLTQVQSGNPLANSMWTLVELPGATLVTGTEPTLDFQEGSKVGGRGSCNRFFGGVEVSGSSIRFRDIGGTLMACPEPIMNQEKRYFAALSSAEQFTLGDSSLVIHYAGSRQPLRFVPRGP